MENKEKNNDEPYVLGDIELYKKRGIFDIDSKIDIDCCKPIELAKDIYNSNGYDDEDYEFNVKKENGGLSKEEHIKGIAENLFRGSDWDRKGKKDSKDYGLVVQIKKSLGFDLEYYYNNPSDEEKIECYKLLKILYCFTKGVNENKNSNGEKRYNAIELFKKPSLDNVESIYDFNPNNREISELQSVLEEAIDYLYNEKIEKEPEGNVKEATLKQSMLLEANKKEFWDNVEKMESMQSILPEVNKLMLEKAIYYSKSNRTKKETVKYKSYFDNILYGIMAMRTDKSQLKLLFSKDVFRSFYYALKLYGIKCMEKSYSAALNEINGYIEDIIFLNEEKRKQFFMRWDNFYIDIDNDEFNINAFINDVLNNPEFIPMITGDYKKNELEANLRKGLADDFVVMIQKYRNVNYGIASNKLTLIVAMLQALYFIRVEKPHYKTDSLGDGYRKRSVTGVKTDFRKENSEEARKEIAKRKEELWEYICENGKAPKDFVLPGERVYVSGKTEGLRIILMTLFPQILYAKNFFEKEVYDTYISSLTKFIESIDEFCQLDYSAWFGGL